MYCTGGHGIVVDGPNNPHLKKILEKAAEQGKVISAVCHGPAGLIPAEVKGKPLVQGKTVRACLRQSFENTLNEWMYKE